MRGKYPDCDRVAAANTDAWVQKYTDAGNTASLVWQRTFNGVANGNDFAFGIATDAMNKAFANAEKIKGDVTIVGR